MDKAFILLVKYYIKKVNKSKSLSGVILLIDFEKLSRAYSNDRGCNRLAYFLEIVANEIEGCFAKQVKDDTWNRLFDFCITFPEYIWRDKCYDGRCYYMIGGYKVYEDDISKLLFQSKRKPPKKIYEVCDNLQDFLRLIESEVRK